MKNILDKSQDELVSCEQTSILESLGGTDLQTTSEEEDSNNYQAASSVEERALNLLGNGVNAESTAAALGVTPARISQLLAEKPFAAKVSQLRYESMQQHNTRDRKYDSIEDKLLHKLEKSLPLLVRPDQILRAVDTVNKAKRRGQQSVHGVSSNQTVVQLLLPAAVATKIITNTNNQVIKAGDQSLLTIPSSNLLSETEKELEGATTVEQSNVQESSQ